MKTLTAVQEGPTNTLALNKDCTQVVVAGRNVFKVYEIKEEGFVERANLRVGKNLNLNFSCNDVAWNQIEEQWLATAATNGAVVLWNLHRPARLKQETVFSDHKRTVNKVTFHGMEQNCLLSGSQDGTMKYFDIRMKEASVTFVSNAESVRDVQFNPQQYFNFAAVSENGTVQLWDLRRHDKCEKQFTAHSGPVFACDWHPEIKNWLATAGRDRNIKVWDLGYRPVLEHTVPTMASVGRIKWRPQRTYHIASCALVVDSSIHVWDIRRPYIPRASFNEHKDISTGIAWRGCPKTLLSTSKDCTLMQHWYEDADRPLRNANPVCVTFNTEGTVALAAAVHKDKKIKTKPANTGTKKGQQLDTFVPIRCTVFEFDNQPPSPSQVFRTFASNYILCGKSLPEICEHNASVAAGLGRHQIAATWGILKLLYGYNSHETTGAVAARGATAAAVLSTRDDENSSAEGPKESRPGTRHQSGNAGTSAADAVSVGGNASLPSVERTEASAGMSDAESEIEEHDSQERNLSHIASGLHFHSDFLFSDGDIDGIGEFGFGASSYLLNGDLGPLDYRVPEQDWILPSEAFQPRIEAKDRSPPQESFATDTSFQDQSYCSDSQTVQVENQTSALLCLPGTHEIASWNGTNTVVDMLNHLAEEGDIQTVVSLVVTLGDRIRPFVDDVVLEHWFLSYIDLLHRFMLWNTAALVIRMSPIRSVQQLSQQSTTVHTNCRKCKRGLLRSGWLCDSCKSVTNTCSVCLLVVRGLYVWCQGCCHGGHVQHIMEWFSSNTACPMGCGHQCEY